jgi:guanine deaminase
VTAIRDACRRLKTFRLEDCEIYASCEPCPMCLAAIYWARLGKIFYAGARRDAAAIGFDDDFLYREVARPVSRRKIPMRQLLRGDALKVFKEWRDQAGQGPAIEIGGLMGINSALNLLSQRVFIC